MDGLGIEHVATWDPLEAREKVIFAKLRPSRRLQTGSVYRRTWFLERVLKLGLVNIAKEYLCVSIMHNVYAVDEELTTFISVLLVPILLPVRAPWRRSGVTITMPYFVSVW